MWFLGGYVPKWRWSQWLNPAFEEMRSRKIHKDSSVITDYICIEGFVSASDDHGHQGYIHKTVVDYVSSPLVRAETGCKVIPGHDID